MSAGWAQIRIWALIEGVSASRSIGFRCRVSGVSQPPAAEEANLIREETNEHRTLNVQHRILYSVNLKKTEQRAAQASGLGERIDLSNFCSSLWVPANSYQRSKNRELVS